MVDINTLNNNYSQQLKAINERYNTQINALKPEMRQAKTDWNGFVKQMQTKFGEDFDTKYGIELNALQNKWNQITQEEANLILEGNLKPLEALKALQDQSERNIEISTTAGEKNLRLSNLENIKNEQQRTYDMAINKTNQYTNTPEWKKQMDARWEKDMKTQWNELETKKKELEKQYKSDLEKAWKRSDYYKLKLREARLEAKREEAIYYLKHPEAKPENQKTPEIKYNYGQLFTPTGEAIPMVYKPELQQAIATENGYYQVGGKLYETKYPSTTTPIYNSTGLLTGYDTGIQSIAIKPTTPKLYDSLKEISIEKPKLSEKISALNERMESPINKYYTNLEKLKTITSYDLNNKLKFNDLKLINYAPIATERANPNILIDKENAYLKTNNDFKNKYANILDPITGKYILNDDQIEEEFNQDLENVNKKYDEYDSYYQFYKRNFEEKPMTQEEYTTYLGNAYAKIAQGITLTDFDKQIIKTDKETTGGIKLLEEYTLNDITGLKQNEIKQIENANKEAIERANIEKNNTAWDTNTLTDPLIKTLRMGGTYVSEIGTELMGQKGKQGGLEEIETYLKGIQDLPNKIKNNEINPEKRTNVGTSKNYETMWAYDLIKRLTGKAKKISELDYYPDAEKVAKGEMSQEEYDKKWVKMSELQLEKITGGRYETGRLLGEVTPYFTPVMPLKAGADIVSTETPTQAGTNIILTAGLSYLGKTINLSGQALLKKTEKLPVIRNVVSTIAYAGDKTLPVYFTAQTLITANEAIKLAEQGQIEEAKKLDRELGQTFGAGAIGGYAGTKIFDKTAGKLIYDPRTAIEKGQISYREGYDIAKQLLSEDFVTGTRGQRLKKANELLIRDPSSRSDTSAGKAGLFATLTRKGEDIYWGSRYFLNKAENQVNFWKYDQNPIINATRKELMILKDIPTGRKGIPKKLKTEILNQLSTKGKVNPETIKLYLTKAQEYANKTKQPVATISPKRLKGNTELENEIFIIFPKGTKKWVIKDKQTLGFTDVENAPIVETSIIGKPINKLTLNERMLRNVTESFSRKAHLRKDIGERATLKYEQIKGEKPRLPFSYESEQHGTKHATNVYRNLIGQKNTNTNIGKELSKYSNKELELLAFLHDTVKIGAGETFPEHGKTIADLIKTRNIKNEGVMEIWDAMPKWKQKEFAKALETHTTIRPMKAWLSKNNELDTAISGTIQGLLGKPLQKALANADRLDFTRFNTKPDTKLLFNAKPNKEITSKLKNTVKESAKKNNYYNRNTKSNISFYKTEQEKTNYPYRGEKKEYNLTYSPEYKTKYNIKYKYGNNYQTEYKTEYDPKYKPYKDYTPYNPYKPPTPYTPYTPYTPNAPYTTYTPYTPNTPTKTPPKDPPKNKTSGGNNKSEKKYTPILMYGKERIPSELYYSDKELAKQAGMYLVDTSPYRRFTLERVDKEEESPVLKYNALEKFITMPNGVIQEKKKYWEDSVKEYPTGTNKVKNILTGKNILPKMKVHKKPEPKMNIMKLYFKNKNNY